MLRFLFILIPFVVACNTKTGSKIEQTADSIPRQVEMAAANLAGNFSRQTTLKLDSTDLGSFFNQYDSLKSFEKDVRSFYAGRNNALAWHDNNGLIEQAGHLYNRLTNLQHEGLAGTVPYINVLDSIAAAYDPADKSVASETDLLLTSVYFYFAERVWGGIDEKKTRKIDWYLPRKKIDYQLWLDSLLKNEEAFAKAEKPVYRQYYLLKPFLEKYQALEKQTNQKPLVMEGKRSYKPGDSSELIANLRQRLYELGDISNATNNPVFDAELEAGIKSFQGRFGLKQDGVIGKELLRELNVPIQKRLQQINVNLERSRWIPNEMEGEYLAVNIPEFKLHAYSGDSLLWSMNVVVGKPMHKTVIFSGKLKYVVFSPYWNVPPGILKNEVLPGIRRNKNYLASHHMEWNGNSVRQKPGPWNSLGQVKFLFPNSYSIYLHDTPSKGLFGETDRAFSHGCIRVAEPKKLAQFLLRDDAAWTEKKITAAMNSGKEQYVTLKNEIPVFIAYLTAWVDRQGKLNFRKDIYDRDARLAAMIVD